MLRRKWPLPISVWHRLRNDASFLVSLPQSFPDQQEALGDGQGSKEEPHSPCSTLLCWIVVGHFCISLLLSLFGQVTDTHSALSFLPWHAEEVRTVGKGLLLTCHWVFLSSFLQQIKLLDEEPYFGKAKYNVVSGLVLNSHMFPG